MLHIHECFNMFSSYLNFVFSCFGRLGQSMTLQNRQLKFLRKLHLVLVKKNSCCLQAAIAIEMPMHTRLLNELQIKVKTLNSYFCLFTDWLGKLNLFSFRKRTSRYFSSSVILKERNYWSPGCIKVACLKMTDLSVR